jgi:hypothetical protein
MPASPFSLCGAVHNLDVSRRDAFNDCGVCHDESDAGNVSALVNQTANWRVLRKGLLLLHFNLTQNQEVNPALRH